MRKRPYRVWQALSRLRIPAAAVLILALAASASGRAYSPAAGTLDASDALQSQAFSIGAENSWIRVQNVGGAEANVTVAYFDETGRLIAGDGCPSVTCPFLRPGQGWSFFQAANFALPRGFSGSAVVYSDQPLVALQAKDVGRDGASLVDGSTTGAAATGATLYLPLLMSRAGPWQTWNSRFAVENLGDSIACVTTTYLSNARDAEISWDPYRPGQNGTPLWGCPYGGRPIAPHGTLFRDATNFGVPAGFIGAARFDTVANFQNVPPERQPITASGDTWNAPFKLLTSQRALTANEMSNVVLLPLVEREVGALNSFSTQFEIENVHPAGAPAFILLRIEGFDLDDGSFVAKQGVIGVGAARMCVQASDDLANCLAPGDRLPRNFSGTARLVSSSPIGVTVMRGSYFYNYTDYHGRAVEQASNRVVLPLLSKRSWFRVQVADGAAANVRIRYLGLDLPGGEQSHTVAAFRELTIFQVFESMVPASFAGTAILESDRPIVAVADVSVDSQPGDRELQYDGVPAP